MTNPDKDGWIEHTLCPVAPGAIVSVKFRDGRQFAGPAENLSWGACGSGTITHYRVCEPVKPAEAKPAAKAAPASIAASAVSEPVIYKLPEPESPTLRDRFAMAALTGLCASLNGTDNWEVLGNEGAIYAYEFADAMLAARKGGAE